jgi:hypothetical protein
MSRLADGIEAVQVGMAEELLDNVDVLMRAGVSSEFGLRHLVTCLHASSDRLLGAAPSA